MVGLDEAVLYNLLKDMGALREDSPRRHKYNNLAKEIASIERRLTVLEENNNHKKGFLKRLRNNGEDS